MYRSMYGLYLKGVNACISLILESVLIFSKAKGLTLTCHFTRVENAVYNHHEVEIFTFL